ncbi:MAG: hypothetical protein GKS02_01600 [Alphaproteobacteria bacterium]|nr:hypothetical protein [Alphaproteobacteria bacterium]
MKVRVGQGSPEHALTLAYLPLGVFVGIALSSLFSFAFRLGFAPPVISLGLLAALIIAVGVASRQFRASAAAGTRLTLGHMGIVCLLGGVAAAPPAEFPPLMLWSLAALAGTAATVLMMEAWLTEKIAAAGPFSRMLGQQAHGLLVLSAVMLLWRSGRIDAWVIVVGAVHYILLILSLVLPALRRKSTAVWRPHARFALGVVLAVALAPIVPPVLVTTLAVVALGLALAGSASDISVTRT